MTTVATPLDFAVDGNAARDPNPGECYYRVELVDGREALIAASDVSVQSGSLVAVTHVPARPEQAAYTVAATHVPARPTRAAYTETTLILAPGTWLSVYVCEAMFGHDPGSILALTAPEAVAK